MKTPLSSVHICNCSEPDFTLLYSLSSGFSFSVLIFSLLSPSQPSIPPNLFISTMDHQQTSAMVAYRKGSVCEVMMVEEGLLGSWWRAWIVDASDPHTCRVEYAKLFPPTHLSGRTGGGLYPPHLEEDVPRHRIRPLLPTMRRVAYFPSQKVEVREKGAWWEGRIVKFHSAKQRYEVEFDHYDNHLYKEEDIRLHMSWENGKYVNNYYRVELLRI